MLQRLSKYRGVLIAVMIPYLWLVAVRMISLDAGGEAAGDSYYHVGMADRFPGACVGKTFPWTTMSIWKDHFYDKELLYHAVLAGLRGYNKLVGLSLDPPFHFPALIFDLLLIAVFTAFAASRNIPRLYVFATALVVLCPFYTQRLLMLRPHVLAITIMLAYCWHLTSARRLWLTFGFGFFTAYAYSNPHFILLPAAVFALLTFRTDRRMAVLVPSMTLAGLLAGLTFHPQFPNTFLLWKIQCVDVIRQTILQESPVYLGTELYHPTLLWFGQNIAFFLVLLLNGAGLRFLLQRIRLRELSFDTSFFLILQLMTTLGVLVSKRVLEYGWPFAALAAGLLFRDLMQKGFFERFTAEVREKVELGTNATIAGALLAFGFYVIQWVTPYQTGELRDFGEWASKNLPARTAIANPNWSDFPMLFYSAPQFRYSLGIEPMFAYDAMPEKITKLEAFRTGRLMMSPEELAKLTDARFAFVSMHAWRLARDMHLSGYFFVYQGDDGWLFDLKHPLPAPAAKKSVK